MAKTKNLLFVVLAAFFMSAVFTSGVKAQDPAPAKESVTSKLTNAEASVTLKAVDNKIVNVYQVKQENKKFAYPDVNNLKVSEFGLPVINTIRINYSRPNRQKHKDKFSQTENRRLVSNTNYSAHTITKRDICYLRT